jgi:HAD superfamily hydrolase (TIGR01509 family)
MDWIHNYQLILFDLDGLLVNTELLHYHAYRNMLQARGFTLPWDFNRYCHTAHYHSDKIANELSELFPNLYGPGENWDKLYGEKKQVMIDQLNAGKVALMPGVAVLLKAIQKANITCCVVTHSPDELVSIIRKQHAVLDAIPHWVTRHDYVQAKPNSECYLKAIEKYGSSAKKIIGFEDTPRGLTALMGTRAEPVLICEVDYPEIPEFIARGARHFPSFVDFFKAFENGVKM